jgi:hypothetical protein
LLDGIDKDTHPPTTAALKAPNNPLRNSPQSDH